MWGKHQTVIQRKKLKTSSSIQQNKQKLTKKDNILKTSEFHNLGATTLKDLPSMEDSETEVWREGENQRTVMNEEENRGGADYQIICFLQFSTNRMALLILSGTGKQTRIYCLYLY